MRKLTERFENNTHNQTEPIASSKTPDDLIPAQPETLPAKQMDDPKMQNQQQSRSPSRSRSSSGSRSP